jgi:glycosyltransferase involved in cell wall biosynthesis
MDRPDLVFVVAPQNRGQILEGICERLAARTGGATAFHYGSSPLPPARAYFFSHYRLFLKARRDRMLRSAESYVWYTHPGYPASEARSVARMLRAATRVFVTCTKWERELIDAGLPGSKVTVVLGGADPDRFRRHDRSRGAVGFCSRYQPRKSPETVLGLVRALPHRDFHLLGTEWRMAPCFPELDGMPNFEYVELDLDQSPRFYDAVDVFVSPADVEGGPIPLLEAMMANAVPVATRTGFAPDLIRHGDNGFLCDPGAGVDEFAGLVEAAYALDTDVRATVVHLTWDAFADALLGHTVARASSRPGGSTGEKP